MSYLTVSVKIVTVQDASMEYRLVLSDTQPTPAEGYLIHPTPIEIEGIQGKLWLEHRIISA